jgi:hypothetical protein
VKSLLTEIYDLHEYSNVQDIDVSGGTGAFLPSETTPTNSIVDKFKKMRNMDNWEDVDYVHRSIDNADSEIYFSKADSNHIFQFPGPSYTMTTSEPSYFDRQDSYPIRAFSYY